MSDGDHVELTIYVGIDQDGKCAAFAEPGASEEACWVIVGDCLDTSAYVQRHKVVVDVPIPKATVIKSGAVTQDSE